MKFLCVGCDEQMEFAQRDQPGDGTLAAVFECPDCGRAVGMLTNPMETQLVSSLGVEIGERTVEQQPMESTRKQVASGREDAFDDGDLPAAAKDAAGGDDGAGGEGTSGGDSDGDGDVSVTWTEDAADRLERVPSFVRGMVHRIYTDWAQERGIEEITPEVMDRARSDLGLEGM